MNKIRCCADNMYHIISVFSIAYVTWKIVRRCHAWTLKNKGHAIQASVQAASEKLEETAIALDELSENGLSESIGKGLGDVLAETKKTINLVSELVKSTLSHAQ